MVSPRATTPPFSGLPAPRASGLREPIFPPFPLAPSAVPDFSFERPHWTAGRLVAGLDEAGRGCLAGPVAAAAVVFPMDLDPAALGELTDSKKLSPEKRAALVPVIYREALGVGVGWCSALEIDETNVLRAALEAMRRAVLDLALAPAALLIDGNRPLPRPPAPQETIVKGDGRSLSIAAASVVAKVLRDRHMEALDARYPAYGFAGHKGYPTAAHYDALDAHGPSDEHRRTFRLVRR